MIKRALYYLALGVKYSKRLRKQIVGAVIIEAIIVGLLYQLNQTYGNLYQSIQDYNQAGIYKAIGTFAAIAMILVFANGYATALINRLAFELRMVLTKDFIQKLAEGRLAQTDNFAQRIQEDCRKFSESIAELGVAVFKAGLKLPLFVMVVIGLTKWYVGLIIVAAVILGTIATQLAGRRLIKSTAKMESQEADLRQSIAEGRINESRTNIFTLSQLFTEWNKRFKFLALVQSGIGQAFVLLPFIILMPLYISKSITMGAFFQSTNALGKVIDSLSVLIDSRQTIVQVQTSIVRMDKLHN